MGKLSISAEIGRWDLGQFKRAKKEYRVNKCFRPPSLLVEGLLSMGATPCSFYLLVEMGLG